MAKLAQIFSAVQASDFAGLSPAMVNYLVREGIIAPSAGPRRGRGVQRRFTFGDLVIIKAIARLLQAGVSVYRLRPALAAFRNVHASITPTRMPAAYLVSDGEEVYLRHDSGVLELLSKRQFAFAFVLEIDSVRRDAVKFAARKGGAPSDLRIARQGGRSRRAA